MMMDVKKIYWKMYNIIVQHCDRINIFRIFCQVFHLLLIFPWYFPSLVLRITRSDAQYEIGTDSIKMFCYKGRMWRKKSFFNFKQKTTPCPWWYLISLGIFRVSLDSLLQEAKITIKLLNYYQRNRWNWEVHRLCFPGWLEVKLWSNFPS